MNGESVLFTKSSRSLETRPLRAFIITSICSFIACISARMGGGVASVREGMLEFRLSVLLGSLLPSCFSSPLLSELSPWFSSWPLCPGFFYPSCSSRSWFCFVRRSTVAARVWTCLSNAVGLGGSSLWTSLVVAIEHVSTMQLLCPGVDNSLSCHDQPFPTDGANWWCRKVHQWDARSLRSFPLPTRENNTKTPPEGAGVEPAKHPPKVKSEMLLKL